MTDIPSGSITPNLWDYIELEDGTTGIITGAYPTIDPDAICIRTGENSHTDVSVEEMSIVTHEANESPENGLEYIK